MPSHATVYFADSRSMSELPDASIHLAVTSPPYWHIKDYGVQNQIGYGQSLHQYLTDLYRVWSEAFRVLASGRRLVVNIGDQFARSMIYGRYKVIPLHAEVISQCERIGFDFMGSIIWQKKTSMNTTGGASVMGSYPHPPNGMVEIDYEYILIFKKPGKPLPVSAAIKQQSKLTKDEWKEYFLGHWCFAGARQLVHEAMFPDELPRRVIKMFSFVGETVLDPFLGSGTTAKAALALERSCIGYEISNAFRPVIENKLGLGRLALLPEAVTFRRGELRRFLPPAARYEPSIQDAAPRLDPGLLDFRNRSTYKVAEVSETNNLIMNTGLHVRLLGLAIDEANRGRVREYLDKYVLGKEVTLRFDPNVAPEADTVAAYVYLKNRIFINKYLVQSGMAGVDRSATFSMKDKFLKLAG